MLPEGSLQSAKAPVGIAVPFGVESPPVRRFPAATIAATLSLWVAAAEAQTGRPTATAVAIGEGPVLDGAVLDDAVWQAIEPASGLTQTRPYAGQPGTEQTEVRFAFTDDTLFVAVVCHDREPEGIVISDSRRDSPLNETDSFQVILDTFRDGRNGFVFGTNPAGIEYDGQVVGGGSGVFSGMGGSSRFRGGSSTGFNLNWDGAWNVATQIGDFGWSAELAIPFRTLRYPSADVQTWGLNFQRNIARHREVSFWSELDRNHELDRLTDAGSLQGVEPPPQRNLKLIPYAIGSSRELPAADSGDESDSDIGLDLKYSVTPSLTLDLTYNTDFAQVEVDEQQVNLDRFNLFFPEKRPFFLENAGLFTVGARSGGSRASAPGRPVLQPPDRHRTRWRTGPDRLRRPALGQGRPVQRRAAPHADRHGGRAPWQQLRGRPPQPRVGGALQHRRDVRQPRGGGQPGAGERHQPRLRHRRQVGHRRAPHDRVVRRPDRHAGTRRRRQPRCS